MKQSDVDRLTRELHARRLVHSCMTCVYFDGQAERCALYQQRPPAYVIAYGCRSWEDTELGEFTPPDQFPLT